MVCRILWGWVINEIDWVGGVDGWSICVLGWLFLIM